MCADKDFLCNFAKILHISSSVISMPGKNSGYIYGVIAAASYGLNPVFALPLLEGGMDAVSILFSVTSSHCLRFGFSCACVDAMLQSGLNVSCRYAGWDC